MGGEIKETLRDILPGFAAGVATLALFLGPLSAAGEVVIDVVDEGVDFVASPLLDLLEVDVSL